MIISVVGQIVDRTHQNRVGGDIGVGSLQCGGDNTIARRGIVGA